MRVIWTGHVIVKVFVVARLEKDGYSDVSLPIWGCQHIIFYKMSSSLFFKICDNKNNNFALIHLELECSPSSATGLIFA
jgi:hypothetical protein